MAKFVNAFFGLKTEPVWPSPKMKSEGMAKFVNAIFGLKTEPVTFAKNEKW